MAIDVARAKPLLDQDADRFRQFFTAQASLRSMPTAMMLGPDQSVIVKADIRLPPEVQDPPLPPVERLGQIGDAEAVAGMLRPVRQALIKLRL
jgi:two-component system nitrogen regulation sensor histidine kinase NtrY